MNTPPSSTCSITPLPERGKNKMPEKSTVMYGRTINLGNYNSERIDVKLTVSDDQDEATRMKEAYEIVKKQAMEKHADKIRENSDLPF